MQASPAKKDAFKWLWAVAELPASMKEKAVLFPLALHADADGFCYPGETTLCRESGLLTTTEEKRARRHSESKNSEIGGERTLRRWLRRLEDKGWIQTDRNSRPVKINGRTLYLNVYRLTIPLRRADSIVSPHDAATGGQIEHDGRTNDPMTGGQNAPQRADSIVSDKCPRNGQGTSRRRKNAAQAATKGGLHWRAEQKSKEFASEINPRII